MGKTILSRERYKRRREEAGGYFVSFERGGTTYYCWEEDLPTVRTLLYWSTCTSLTAKQKKKLADRLMTTRPSNGEQVPMPE